MNIEQIRQVHINNQNHAWRKAHEAAIARFMDEGNSYADASTLADECLFQLNWILANPEE